MEEILASIRRIISEDDKNVKLDDVIDLHPNRETLDPEFTNTKIDENVPLPLFIKT
jgi:cell pole-organizing protein PopZ